jgi:hypothetical protein
LLNCRSATNKIGPSPIVLTGRARTEAVETGHWCEFSHSAIFCASLAQGKIITFSIAFVSITMQACVCSRQTDCGWFAIGAALAKHPSWPVSRAPAESGRAAKAAYGASASRPKAKHMHVEFGRRWSLASKRRNDNHHSVHNLAHVFQQSAILNRQASIVTDVAFFRRIAFYVLYARTHRLLRECSLFCNRSETVVSRTGLPECGKPKVRLLQRARVGSRISEETRLVSSQYLHGQIAVVALHSAQQVP